MKLTVIMPSLNVHEYIEQSINSVRKQTITDYEILCIDAGSTDGTVEIIERICERDKRVSLIHSEKKSYGYQINLGIERAKGDYIGIVETDDFIDNRMYSELLKWAKSTNADYIKSNYYEVYSECGVMKQHEIDLDNSVSWNEVIDLTRNREAGMTNLVHIWSGIYKTSFLRNKKVYFHESQGASFQDVSFSILIGLFADSCVFVNEPHYYYRTDNPNSSVKSDAKYHCIIDEYDFLNQRLDDIQNSDIQYLIKKRKLIDYVWNMNRLDFDIKSVFMDCIAKELDEYENDTNIMNCLDDSDRSRIEYLRDFDTHKELELSKRENVEIIKSIIALALQNEKFAVLGAGRICKMLLEIQYRLGVTFITEIGDNSPEIQGKKVLNYSVKRILDVVDNTRNCNYIIANKKNSDEIFSQLLGFGIEENKIMVVNQLTDIEKLGI